MNRRTVWLRVGDYTQINEPVTSLIGRLLRALDWAREDYPEGFNLLLSKAEMELMFPGQTQEQVEEYLGVKIGLKE